MKFIIIAATLLIAVAGGARAQTTADDTPVVVKGRHRGPPMWILTKGESTVLVLGTLQVAPKGIAWNSVRFRKNLRGANALILPRIINDWGVSTDDMELPPGFTLKGVVPERTYQHFRETLKRENIEPLTDVPNYRPAWLGAWLTVQIYRSHNLTTDMVPAGVLDFANLESIPVIYVDRHVARVQQAQFDHFNSAADAACLDEELRGIDHSLKTMDEVSAAWATGDVSTVLSNQSDAAWVNCFSSQSKFRRSYNGFAINDMAKEIEKAIKVPGKTVAVVPMQDLLRKGGILERLGAKHIKIDKPDE